ncbi:type II secretion system protein M [Sulfitobacter albidus]|uniref:Type II secretion system protein M n=1 Tax=Sulfitobacter albidus TaxID=2829501 RepID=A0A975JEH2_9RHOB|nr:type II secretion system protein M [Sulfitobacter albidus]QUJ76780.1 type II secretion system protein M [Sulfitobacter albidus]
MMSALASLTPRERALVLGGAAVLLVLGTWVYVWQPIARAQDAQADRIARYLTLIELSRQNGGAAARPAAPVLPDTPLAQRLTQSGERAGITLARLDPEGPRLRVTVAEAAYADLIDWIATLEAQSGVRAISVEMSRLTAPGMVSLRMTVEDAQ